MPKDDDLAPIRNYLASGHSVYELAKASGVPRSTIQSWLDRGVPATVELWQRVLNVVDMPPVSPGTSYRASGSIGYQLPFRIPTI